ELQADTVIFNTCSVRDHAEQRVLSRLAQLRGRRESEPDFRLGIMGCFAERDGAELLQRLPYLDFAVGTRQFMRLPEILSDLDSALPERGKPGKAAAFGETEIDHPGVGQAHRRGRHHGIQAYVSVMRGCSNRCSYCIVPDVRGGEISRPAGEIAAEVKALALAGAREVTLLGQNIDAYGKPDSSLAALLRRIDAEAPADTGLVRIRFVTSHPRDINRELVETVAALPRVCRHFHMPAQSGSDRILSAMRRGYDRRTYDEKLALIQSILPEALIASDFIVGFPGETEEDFLATMDLVQKANYQNSYIFKYSPRPGTPAALEMEDDVPDPVKRDRNARLLAAQNQVNLARADAMLGREVEIMVEGRSARDASRWTGRTDTNLICVFPAPADGADWAGRLIKLRVASATGLPLHGEVV
ncbi:MAG: tRNA (N6-isopentenyl adenosine(37)-C2)-methylthiotransferase MiaB, partial [Planctomycetes bacterium]|nr:tRNA (N6-isopentenyl adenosine(37)-C2)-methylthiotransferase MiaB [Planctomycetota bacterium]